MEANRLNIVKEKDPTLILVNMDNPMAQEIEVGDKGHLKVTLEVIKQVLEPDENGNEIMKYTLKVIESSRITEKDLRQ